MAVELPLERLISFGEPGDLRVDQPVQLRVAQIPEVAVLDPPVMTEPKGADEWTLALDGHPRGKRVRYVRPQLRVVEVAQSVRLTYHASESKPSRDSRPSSCGGSRRSASTQGAVQER